MRGKVPIKIPDDARKQAIASIELEPTVYNQAISDARSYCEEQTADLGAIYHQSEFPHWDTRKRTKEC